MLINVDVKGLYQFCLSEVEQIENISPYDLEVCRSVERVLDIVRDTPSEFFPVYILEAFKEACEHQFDAPHLLHASDLMAAYVLFKVGCLDETELYRASNCSFSWYKEILRDIEEPEEPLEGPDDVLFDDNGEVPF